MKTIRSLYLLFQMLLIVVLFNSCDELFNCLDGNGIQGTEERIFTKFSSVENATAFDLEIIPDTDYRVVLYADENLLPFIETDLIGGDLVIRVEYNRCLNSSNPISVEVFTPEIDQVEMTGSGTTMVSYFISEDVEFRNSGSGEILAWNFECTNLDVTNSGSGDINITDIYCDEGADVTLTGSGDVILTGQAPWAVYLVTGSGSILADDFPVNTCSASNSGSGDIFCNVHQSLNAVLTGSGDIYYSGSPAVLHTINTGSGRIIPSFK